MAENELNSDNVRLLLTTQYANRRRGRRRRRVRTRTRTRTMRRERLKGRTWWWWRRKEKRWRRMDTSLELTCWGSQEPQVQ